MKFILGIGRFGVGVVGVVVIVLSLFVSDYLRVELPRRFRFTGGTTVMNRRFHPPR